MDKYEELMQLQRDYDRAIRKASMNSKADLAYYADAAVAQYRMGKMTTPPASDQHFREMARLVDLIEEGRKKLGLVPQKKPVAKPAPDKDGKDAGDADSEEDDKELEGFDAEKYRFKEKPNVTWDDVIGMEEAVNTMRRALTEDKEARLYVNLRTPVLEKMGRRHTLLYGPPGTGKTHLCRAVANQIMQEEGGAFFFLEPADVFSKYVGGAEKRLKAVFKAAEKYENPVICFDEFENFCPERGDSNVSENKKVLVTSFLQYVEGVGGKTNALFMCASNYPWKIDKAMRSRLVEKAYLNLPTREAIMQFLGKNVSMCLGVDEKERTRLIELLADNLVHASYRNLNSVAIKISEASKAKTIEMHPGEYHVSVFEPLDDEQLLAIVKDEMIEYDEDYMNQLGNPKAW